GLEVDLEGTSRPQEERRHGGRAHAREGSSEGQPDAVAGVDVEPDEPAREARDASRIVPDDGRDARRDRHRQAGGRARAHQRAPGRRAPRADDARSAGPPQPPPRAPPALIDRYTRPAMGRIWSEQAKYEAWLQVELAVCEAFARRGTIPADALARIRAGARVDVARILEIQRRVKHEMIALLTSLEEQLGADSRYVHVGLTSSDVWDTATALQLRAAADLLIAGQERVRSALRTLALRYQDTPRV